MENDRQAIASLLRRFAQGQTHEWEFDDFISVPANDDLIEQYRLEVADLPTVFPPETSSHFVSQAGVNRLLAIADSLEQSR